MEWRPVQDDDMRDIWVVFRPTETWYLEDLITLTAGATTVSGEPVESATFEFQIAPQANEAPEPVWQPQNGEDFGVDGLDLSAESSDTAIVAAADSPPLAEGMGTPFMIGPERVYDVPQRVWLPVPAEVNSEDVQLYYYHPNGEDAGWYPAEAVEGWLVPDSYLHLRLDDTAYLGFLVRHAGIVQLGVPTGE